MSKINIYTKNKRITKYLNRGFKFTSDILNNIGIDQNNPRIAIVNNNNGNSDDPINNNIIHYSDEEKGIYKIYHPHCNLNKKDYDRTVNHHVYTNIHEYIKKID